MIKTPFVATDGIVKVYDGNKLEGIVLIERKNPPDNSTPLIAFLAKAKVTENIKSTTTSFIIVIPKTMSVNVPFALYSLIMAIVEAGDFATAMTPKNRQKNIKEEKVKPFRSNPNLIKG